MEAQDKKTEYIKLRAEGRSYSYIAEQLHISKSTCTKWNKELNAQIAELKQEQLNELYTTYHMYKEARIKTLGDILENIDTALAEADLSQIAPEKLLDFKLKYTEALKEEYIGTEAPYKFSEKLKPEEIVTALGDLLERIRAGEVTAEQAQRESGVITNLLRAYDTVEIKAKLEALETVVGSRV